MHQINIKEGHTQFGAKKVIRLLKNLRSDSDYSDGIKLSSYDIAGVVWHFDNSGLTVAPWFELRLLEVTNSRLQSMVANKARTMALRTPDDTRCVIDSEAKFGGLCLLSFEVSQLCEAVANEISPLGIPMPNTVQKSLQDAYIP